LRRQSTTVAASAQPTDSANFRPLDSPADNVFRAFRQAELCTIAFWKGPRAEGIVSMLQTAPPPAD
jgi:hypothetical protein